MKIQAEKIKSRARDIAQKFPAIAKERLNWLLPLIFAILVAYSVYIWYFFAFNPTWSEEKTNEYIRTNQREVVFQKDRFDSVITTIKERRTSYLKNLQGIPDIFKIK